MNLAITLAARRGPTAVAAVRQLRPEVSGSSPPAPTSFEHMTDLAAGAKCQRLAEEFAPLGSAVARRLTSCDGTEKLLLRLSDGHLARMRAAQGDVDRRHRLHVSTQVGCGMGCVFCGGHRRP